MIVFCFPACFLLPQNSLAAEHGIEKIFYLPKYNAVKGVESLNKNWQKIDIIAPQMHIVEFVGASAKITGGFGPKLKKAISDYKLKVMPLIANANFSQKIMHQLLISSYEQDRVITGLVYLAKRDGYIGWQFDFENISYLDKDLFSAFTEKTYKVFKEKGLVLSVVAVARSVDYEDTNAFKNWSGVYDYKRLADSTDFISLMVYDDPNSVGPVASIDFVNKTLNYVKDKIPAEKLSLGVPLYYWKWDMTAGKKVGSGLYSNIINIMANFRYQPGFDKTLGASWISYSYGNKNYAIWFEDKNSFEIRLDIIKENNLRGFSAWLLGGEDPAIWSILAKNN
ncbi:MAG: glycosyl hydrolase family 18 protein [Candidatus Staskawiczbacteria bacterium]|nr:glycosyl hydrolase family 18 protein [Candidatus Staskawiczbacteria bacterium]